MLLEINFLPFNVRMSKCSACGALLIDCLLQREKFAWRKCTGLTHWQPFPLFHPLPVASPCSCSTFLLSDIQSFHFVNLTQWAWARGRGMYISTAKNSHCIFRHFLINKGCFVGTCFSSLHQLFLSGSHLSQLMAPPEPSHRKWGIGMTRGR